MFRWHDPLVDAVTAGWACVMLEGGEREGEGEMSQRRDTEQHGKAKYMKERVNGKEVMNIQNITSCTHACTHSSHQIQPG